MPRQRVLNQTCTIVQLTCAIECAIGVLLGWRTAYGYFLVTVFIKLC
jgi:hypothetical protein